MISLGAGGPLGVCAHLSGRRLPGGDGGRNGIRPGCISVPMTYAERQGLQADSKSASQWVEKQENSINKQTVVISSCVDDE